jgi:sortase (surface protein transpeptidase)
MKGRHRRRRHRLGFISLMALVSLGTILLLLHAASSQAPGGPRTADDSTAALTDRPRPLIHRRVAEEPDFGRPLRVVIPAIGVDAPVIRLGLNSDDTLEVPTDFGVTGWWSGGTVPGRRGPAVIVGHIDSKAGPAVFYRLRELKPSDVVIVQGAGGSVARFVVQKAEQVSKDAFPTERVYGSVEYAALRLITCGGGFDRESGHYLDNLVVYARLTDVDTA